MIENKIRSYLSFIVTSYTERLGSYILIDQRCEFESRSCGVYVIQLYVIKFFSYLRQVSGFPRVLNKPDRHDITKILLKVALNTITITLYFDDCFFLCLLHFINNNI